jgi:hypothetical protein
MMLHKYNYSNPSLAYGELSSLVLHTNLPTQNQVFLDLQATYAEQLRPSLSIPWLLLPFQILQATDSE